MTNLFYSIAPRIHIPQFEASLLVVWSANGDAMVVLLLPWLVPIYLMIVLTNTFVRVFVSSIRTIRAMFAFYKKILDLLDEETVSGESSGRVSL